MVPGKRSGRSLTRGCQLRFSLTTRILASSYRRRSSTGLTTVEPMSFFTSPLSAVAVELGPAAPSVISRPIASSVPRAVVNDLVRVGEHRPVERPDLCAQLGVGGRAVAGLLEVELQAVGAHQGVLGDEALARRVLGRRRG